VPLPRQPGPAGLFLIARKEPAVKTVYDPPRPHRPIVKQGATEPGRISRTATQTPPAHREAGSQRSRGTFHERPPRPHRQNRICHATPAVPGDSRERTQTPEPKPYMPRPANRGGRKDAPRRGSFFRSAASRASRATSSGNPATRPAVREGASRKEEVQGTTRRR